MVNNPVEIADLKCGDGQPLLIIAGPCVLESSPLALQIASELKSVCEQLQLPLVFKASFDKANRTSLDSYRGVGLDSGLEILAKIRSELGVNLTTDLHLPEQAQPYPLLQYARSSGRK